MAYAGPTAVGGFFSDDQTYVLEHGFPLRVVQPNGSSIEATRIERRKVDESELEIPAT